MAKKKRLLYVPAAKSGISEEEAQVWGEELTKFTGNPKDLGANAEEVYDAVKADPSHPLHPLIFYVSQKEAARRHYIEHIRKCSRSIQVQYRPPHKPNNVVLTRAFHNVGGDYYRLDDVMKSDELRARVVATAAAEARAWAKKYRLYKELAGLADTIDQYLDQL